MIINFQGNVVKKLLILLFVALFLVGCNKQNPEDVVLAFIKASYDDDAKTMVELFNIPKSEFERENSKEMVEGKFKMVIAQTKGEAAEFGGLDTIRIKDSNITDNKARVNFEVKFKNGKVQDDHLFLKKTKDGWKIIL